MFANPERYNTRLGNPLRVNTQTYRVLVVPRAQFVTACFARAAAELHAAGLPVLFVDGLPEGICDGEDSLLEPLKDCAVIALEQLAGELAKLSLPEAVFAPRSVYLRAMRCQGDWGLFFFVNEGTRTYTGTVTVPYTGPCYWYDAWRNVTYSASGTASGGSMALALTLEPGHSLILMLDEPDEERLTEPVRCEGVKLPLAGWRRGLCAGIEYPHFQGNKPVSLPDSLAKEKPEFSGYARYEATFRVKGAGRAALEISDAAEGVEVFVNGRSAGIQIVPPFRYDLTGLVKPGENSLAIEVATTLERQCYIMTKDEPRMKMRGLKEPVCGSGITGHVSLYYNETD